MKDKKDTFNQFREKAELFREQPKDQLWELLEEKLDHKRSNKRLRFYRMLAFAAMITTLIASVSLFNHYLSDHNPNLLVSNEGFTALNLEELSNDSKSIFNVSNFQSIRSAYDNRTILTEEIAIGGIYEAEDSELVFNVGFNNLRYRLHFEDGDFPELFLDESDGEKLRFSSSDGKTLELNKKENILKIVGSNFLPIHKNSKFIRQDQQNSNIRNGNIMVKGFVTFNQFVS